MRANRWLSLSVAVLGAMVVLSACALQPSEPKRVEIPVSKSPDRASNDEMVSRTGTGERAMARDTGGVTVVEPSGAAPAPSAKPQAAEPKETASSAPEIVSPAATTAPVAKKTPAKPASAPVASGFGVEEFRFVNQSGEIVTTLKNGMVVISKRIPGSPVLAVRGYVKTGGVYEGKWLGGGLSHLLEHLVAGGSSQRRTEAQNRDLLQKIGNDSNAYTSEDHTAYFINTTPEHLGEAVDLVTGWMLGALITPDEYKREYEVVQRELEKDKGEPDWVFYELGQKTRYIASPARVPTIGYQEVIRGLSRDDVFGYYKQCYQPNNMIFVVSGDLDPAAMLASVQKYVADAPPGRVMSHDIEGEPQVTSPRTTVATFPKLGQTKLQIGFPSVRMDSGDMYALDLLATVLGGGESSALVEELRDKKQLVSAVAASDYTPAYVEGTFQIAMELDPDKVAAATDAALAIVDQVIKTGVDADRLQRAKSQMRAARVKGLQTSEDIASSLGTDFLSSGDPHFSDRYVERIEKVTAEQIKDVATRYLVRQRMLTTALMPAEYVGAGGLPKAEDLLRPIAPTTKEPPAAGTVPQVTRAELPNGAILLHKRLATSPLVVVKMYALGGVTGEDAKTNGLGNLAMELLPRGTKTRNAQQIAEFFDSIGGDLETTCGNNTWSWSMTCLKDDAARAMDVFGDVVNNPSFPDDQAKQMKQRIIAQIEGQDADWFGQANRFFKKVYYGPKNSPYQFLPTGTKETVTGFTADQARKWYRDHVMTSRRVIAIYGDIDLDKAKSLAREHLGVGDPIKSQEAPKSPVGDRTMASSSGAWVDVKRVELNKTEQPLAGIVIGYNADPVLGDPQNYWLDVADTMSSGYRYPTGYLHEILRGRGLVYMVHAQNWPGRSRDLPGTFLVYAGCKPENVNEVIDVILENIARLQGSAKDMQPDWFARSKELITTSDALEHETPAQQAETAALDEVIGLGYNFHVQFPAKIEAVTLEDVRNVSAARLNSCIVTVSTPDPDSVKVKTGKRTYDKFPPVDLTPRGVQHDAK